MTTTTHVTPQEHPSLLRTAGRLLWVTPLAIAVSTVANVLLYWLAGRLVPEVAAWTGAGIGQIIGANIGYLFAGAVVFLVVARVSSRPARHYTIIATIGLVLSMAMPLTAAMGINPPGAEPAGAATAITLGLMHIISYTVSVPLFIRLGLE